MAGEEPTPDPDAWIEKVVKVTSALGMNPTRTRWRLIRWRENRRRADRRREQVIQHIRYEHKICPTCGHVQDRDATSCTRCEAKLGRRGLQILGRLGLRLPTAISVSTVLAVAILAVYVREVVAMGGSLATPSGYVLEQLGAHWPPAVPEEPWRLVTAMFLHIGFWHVGFNLLATASIGPRIEEVYGRGTMLLLFFVTGILACVGSGVVAPSVLSAGASGGIAGLVGVAGGHGQRSGTRAGLELRNDMAKWMLYVMIFGYFIGANNWAHLFGALSGAAIGLALPPRGWMHRRLRVVRAVIGGIAVVILIGALAIIFTRDLTPLPEAPSIEHAGP